MTSFRMKKTAKENTKAKILIATVPRIWVPRLWSGLKEKIPTAMVTLFPYTTLFRSDRKSVV